MAIKVFSMNDCDWVAAETLEEAKSWYKDFCSSSSDPDEEVFDDPHEVSSEDMKKLKFNDEDGSKPVTRTFQEQLDRIVDRGEPFPLFFASSEY